MPSVGFDGNVTEGGEANRLLRGFESAYRHAVWTGGVVTASGRNVSVPAADGHIAGVWFTTDVATLALGTAPSGTNKRIDYIVAEANWNSTASALGTPANSVAVQRVPGTVAAAPTAPTLTQAAGNVWQMPLARVIDSATTVTVEVCRPLPRVDYVTRVTTFSARNLTGDNVPKQAATTPALVDPGWPYRIRVNAAHVFSTGGTTSSDSGEGIVYALLGTSEVGRGRTGRILGASGQHAASFDATTDVRTGTPPPVTLQISATGMAMTNDAGDLVNRFEVTIVPAV